jgi:RNA-binding protein YhbY
VKRRLREEGTIKVRVLRSYLTVSGKTVDEIADEVARAVNAEVVTVRGHVFVLRKRG